MSLALVWSVLTSRAAGPVAVALAVALACFLAAALVGAAAQGARADGMKRERDRWRTTAGRWESAARGLRASFDETEALRRREAITAQAATDQASKACEARVATARRSARAIETIVNREVTRNANGCPDRGLVPVERLRDALAPVR
jgi:hypothetical protein